MNLKDELLSSLQANILKSHGRNHCRCIFIQFNADPKIVRRRISMYADEITSALEQKENTQAYKVFNTLCGEYKNEIKKFSASIKMINQEDAPSLRKKINSISKSYLELSRKNELVSQLRSILQESKISLDLKHIINISDKYEKKFNEYFKKYENQIIITFGLSRTGYKKLGFYVQDLPQDPSFRKGMKNFIVQYKLQDDITNWDPAYQDEIDAVIIIAHNSINRLDESEKVIKNHLAGGGRIMKIEKGKKIKSGKGKNVKEKEHFGFPDGISQPSFFEKETGELKNNSYLSLVLSKEGLNGIGSYLVFRKLEQNVAEFNSQVKKLAKDIFETASPTESQIANIEAQIIGRYKTDSLPLLLKNIKKNRKNIIEQFNNYDPDPQKPLTSQTSLYEKIDPDGIRCPFHAHIRKVNPRSKNSKLRFQDVSGTTYGGSKQIEVRIVRRGYPYDYYNNGKGRKPDLSDEPDREVGLLFMSYQASIRNQFEVIAGWSNSPSFPPRLSQKNSVLTGVDPLIGKHTLNNADQTWNKSLKEQKKALFGGAVNSKGGEYFFVPSISFLKNLVNL